MKYLFIIPLIFFSDVVSAQTDSVLLNVDSTILTKHGKIYFDYDKWTLLPISEQTLDSVAAYLIQNPDLKMEVQNHTDTRDNPNYSVNLSKRRAQTVCDYLIHKGVSKDRLKATGYRGSKPLISQKEIDKLKIKTEQELAHQKNRRTVFVVLK